jgi:hypothetical protein
VSASTAATTTTSPPSSAAATSTSAPTPTAADHGDFSGYLFILAAEADAWASHYILSNETCFPKILEPIKQHLKNHKNTNHSHLDI